MIKWEWVSGCKRRKSEWHSWWWLHLLPVESIEAALPLQRLLDRERERTVNEAATSRCDRILWSQHRRGVDAVAMESGSSFLCSKGFRNRLGSVAPSSNPYNHLFGRAWCCEEPPYRVWGSIARTVSCNTAGGELLRRLCWK